MGAPVSALTDGLFAMAAQLSDMARELDVRRRGFPHDSDEFVSLRMSSITLRNASTDVLTTGIDAALNQLEPHVDALLSGLGL